MKRCRIAFIHPDLGIGGAEKLIVEMALAIQKIGHTPIIFTGFHCKSRAFPETINNKLKVVVAGSWIPISIFGYFHTALAIARMLYLSLYMIVFYYGSFDLVIADQIACTTIPIFRFCSLPVIFYCHFPDKLLSPAGSWLKRLYRLPIDALEDATTSFANVIYVNSKFTLDVVRKNLPWVASKSKKNPDFLKVLYPAIKADCWLPRDENKVLELVSSSVKYLLVSINRFEEKKNLPLAVEAFYKLQFLVSSEIWNQSALILMGGYDERIEENRRIYQQMIDLCTERGLSVACDGVMSEKCPDPKVYIFRCLLEKVKIEILSKAMALIYTPTNEHFGIVPVEAMMAGCPVVACASGGPLETVIDGRTGYLRDPTPDSFSNVLSLILSDDSLRSNMSSNGKLHSASKFTSTSLAKEIDETLQVLVSP